MSNTMSDVFPESSEFAASPTQRKSSPSPLWRSGRFPSRWRGCAGPSAQQVPVLGLEAENWALDSLPQARPFRTRDPLTEEPQAQCCPHRRRVRPRPLQSPCTGPAPTLLLPNPRALGELPKHPGTRPRATDAGCADRPRSCWFSVAPGQRHTYSEPCARSSGTGPSQLSWDTAGSPTGSPEGPPTPRAALLQQEATLSLL